MQPKGRSGLGALAIVLGAIGCGGSGTDPEGSATAGAAAGCGSERAASPPNDPLSPTRRLRRIALVLTGRAPTAQEYQALLLAEDDATREAILDKAVDDALAAPAFYETMREFGREWIGMPAIASVADEPDYMGSQQHNLSQCPDGTTYAGSYAFLDYYTAGNPPCSGKEPDGSDTAVRQIEPWWAPGTSVQVLGRAGEPSTTISVDGKPYDCGADFGRIGAPIAPCTCGPHLVYCHASPTEGYADWPIYIIGNPQGQRRLLWEEPARLIAHVAFYDRPLTDLVLGDYSVGPVELQAAYVRAGRRTGAVSLDSDESWWRPAQLTGLVDPQHDAHDAWAWREFSVPARDPYLLADRDYKFDPRTMPRGSMKGIPAAGVLTMIGMLAAYPRERVRAARMLEAFACESFIPPPADAVFNPYERDPAAEGPCQTCHTRIDPAAIHFKRWSKIGYNIDSDAGAYIMPGIGNWAFPDAWTEVQYPYESDPFLHWIQWWKPNTKMTPISEADASANAETRFIDFLPPDQTLLGEQSDGTVGPLGFAKMIVASGAFDRCAVSRLHERFGGRRIDTATESGYLDALVGKFVAGGRKVRPFLKELTKTDVFRRGL